MEHDEDSVVRWTGDPTRVSLRRLVFWRAGKGNGDCCWAPHSRTRLGNGRQGSWSARLIGAFIQSEMFDVFREEVVVS